MIRLAFTVFLWFLASPVFCIAGLGRLVKRCRFWSIAYRSEFFCHTCGAVVSLVGMWECKCGYTYRGHVLRACRVCDATPRMIRCYSCGTTEMLPKP